MPGILARYRRFREHPYTARFLSIMGEVLPKGLYARALLIIITPIVVLEGVVAFAFMERHWQAVTRRLSEATARDIAAVIDVYKRFAEDRRCAKAHRAGARPLELSMEVLPPGDLPPPQPKPFFRLLDRALSDETAQARAAALLDRHGRPVATCRNPRQARQRHPALRRARAARPTPRTRTSSCSGWSARRSFC